MSAKMRRSNRPRPTRFPPGRAPTVKQIIFRKGYKYQLGRDYIHKLPPEFKLLRPILHPLYSISGGELILKRGYAWDGASGPAIDSPNFMRGSLVHDVFYQMLREDSIPRFFGTTDTRKWADQELRKICIEDGMSKIRAAWVYWAVRRYGLKHSDKPKAWHTAP